MWVPILVGAVATILYFVLRVVAENAYESYKEKKAKKRDDLEHISKFGMTKQEYEKEREQKWLRRQNENRLKIEELLSDLKSRYGSPSFSFEFAKLDGLRNTHTANVYEKGKVVVVMNRKDIVDQIPFASILDFSIETETLTMSPDRATTTTTSSTGSMLKRGLAGGALFGEAGAIVGSATGKRTSETVFEKGEAARTYSISLNLDSITNPICHMYFNGEVDVCKEVAGVLTAIIRRNTNQSESNGVEAELMITTNKNSKYDPLLKGIAFEIAGLSEIAAFMIERHNGIDYHRACSILDQLEEKGVVSSYTENHVTRKVLADKLAIDDLLSDIPDI